MRFLIVIISILFFSLNGLAQFKLISKKNKIGLSYAGKTVIKPSFDSIVINDNEIATAYKKNKAFYINQKGKVIYKGVKSETQPFEKGIGISKNREKTRYLLINSLGKMFLNAYETHHPQRIGNLVFVPKEHGNSLCFNGKELIYSFKNFKKIYYWVSLEKEFSKVEKKKKFLAKDEYIKKYYTKTFYYNTLTGKRDFSGVKEFKEYGNLIYVSDKKDSTGYLYFDDGSFFMNDVANCEFINDSILYITKGNENKEKHPLLVIYNVSQKKVIKELTYKNNLDENRSIFYDNDSVFVGTLEGTRLSANYYKIGEIKNEFIMVYNKYSYSYIDDTNYKKMDYNFPLIDVVIPEKRHLFEIFPILIQLSALQQPKLKKLEATGETYRFPQYNFEYDFAVVPLNNLLKNEQQDSVITLWYSDIKFNYLTKEGGLLNNKKYEVCYPFVNDLAMVKINNSYFIINKTGKAIGKQQYETVQPVKNEYFIVEKNRKYGLIKANYKQIISCKYGELKYVNGEFRAKKSYFDKEDILLDVD